MSAASTSVTFLTGTSSRQGVLGLLAAKRAHLYAVMLMRETFAPAPDGGSHGTPALQGGLLDLGAHCVKVRNGDDLTQVFNP